MDFDVLFFGSNGSLYGDLAVVWPVDSADMVLRVLIAADKHLVVVWWQSGEIEDAGAVKDFRTGSRLSGV